MTKQEYAEYEAAVADFMAREDLENLSTGEPWCVACDKRAPWGRDDCPRCGGAITYENLPYVSSRGCDCCGSSLQQEVEFASGRVRGEGDTEIGEFQICMDCVYYAEYGRLDDATMAGLTDDRET